MANIPGAVTDPSRVRGEAIELKSGSDTIHGYLARPSQPGRNPGIVAAMLADDVKTALNSTLDVDRELRHDHRGDDTQG